MEAQHGAHDVDDAVDGAHLVEVDRLHRHVVDLRLRLAQPLKDRARPLLHRRRQRARPDHLQDLRKMPAMNVRRLRLMRVAVRVREAVRV